MKSEPESDDELLEELPVYLSKTLADKLYVYQYPLRPGTETYDKDTVIKASVRPKSGQVELQLALNTHGATYDLSKGEQIALNVDGPHRDARDPQDNFFQSNVMDKIVLESSKAQCETGRYAIGVIRDSALHLTPVASVVALRPSLAYLDVADRCKNKDARKDGHEEHSDEEEPNEEEGLKRITVKFERPETERGRKAREKSFGFLQKQMQEEPWVPTEFYAKDSERSEWERQQLFCQYQNESQEHLFTLSTQQYLNQLVPPQREVETVIPGLPHHLLSSSALKALPLKNQIATVMLNAVVASFSELLSVLGCGSSDETAQTVLAELQTVAVLVQGNWVVKSEMVYPQKVKEESGVTNETLQRVRDYALFLFTKSITVTRNELAEIIILPANTVKEVLRGIARYRAVLMVWEFLLPSDQVFIVKYPAVAQRQQMIFELRHTQLMEVFGAKNTRENSAKGSGKKVGGTGVETDQPNHSPNRRRKGVSGSAHS